VRIDGVFALGCFLGKNKSPVVFSLSKPNIMLLSLHERQGSDEFNGVQDI
jgi:hypothetical protein